MARISGVSVTTVSVAEALVLDGVTAGTVTASKAVVVDSNKDISALRTAVVTNLDAGASGTAGTVDVFPTTAAKGKIAIVAADSTGDTTTTITNAAQSAAATMTIPDTNGSASFVMTAAAQTIAGAKTFSIMPIIPVQTVAATGTVAADAAQLVNGFNLVTGADDVKGVRLPNVNAGFFCIIKVAPGDDLKVWPGTGDAINALGVNNALTVVDDVCFAAIGLDNTTWYTLPLLPS
jgi:hypothetical protein